MSQKEWGDYLKKSIKKQDLLGVRKALKNNADPNIYYENVESPAFSSYYRKVLKLAIDKGTPEIARELIKFGAYPNWGIPRIEGVKDGTPILLYAVQKRKKDFVAVLMESPDADVEYMGKDLIFESPLSYAKRHGYNDIVKVLEKKDAQALYEEEKRLRREAEKLLCKANELRQQADEMTGKCVSGSALEPDKNGFTLTRALKIMPKFKQSL